MIVYPDAIEYANEILSCFPKHIQCLHFIKKESDSLCVVLKEQRLLHDNIFIVDVANIKDRMVNVRNISGHLTRYTFEDFNEMMNNDA